MSNDPYRSTLGIAVPHLEEIIARQKKVKLFYLMVVALVEHGGPMTLTEIAERLLAVGAGASIDDLELSLKRAWHGSEPVHKRPDGMFALDLASPDLDLILFMTGARPPKWMTSSKVGDTVAQTNRPKPRSDTLRRAVIRTAPMDGPPQAVSVLDINRHTITSRVGDELQMLPEILTGFDLLVGLDVRDSLYLARIDPQAWKLVDLKSAPKSTRLNRSGRTLRITPEMLIKATTGISQPLSEPAKMAGYLKNGERTRVTRRLESDVKALYAFYQYGILHRVCPAALGIPR